MGIWESPQILWEAIEFEGPAREPRAFPPTRPRPYIIMGTHPPLVGGPLLFYGPKWGVMFPALLSGSLFFSQCTTLHSHLFIEVLGFKQSMESRDRPFFI
jgi:hypothetical protein